MSKFDHLVKDGRVNLRRKKDPKDLIIEELKARLEALENAEKKRNPAFKAGSVK